MRTSSWLPVCLLLLGSAGLSLGGMLCLARRAPTCPLPGVAAPEAALTAPVDPDLTPMERV